MPMSKGKRTLMTEMIFLFVDLLKIYTFCSEHDEFRFR